MEIKKFEAYKYGYRGKGIKSTRKEFIEELIDCFVDADILGYECTGTEHIPNTEELYLFLSPTEGGAKESYPEYLCVKLDYSGIGIEIGTRKWDADKEEMGEFNLISNLDSKNAITAKNIKKYNL